MKSLQLKRLPLKRHSNAKVFKLSICGRLNEVVAPGRKDNRQGVLDSN